MEIQSLILWLEIPQIVRRINNLVHWTLTTSTLSLSPKVEVLTRELTRSGLENLFVSEVPTFLLPSSDHGTLLSPTGHSGPVRLDYTLHSLPKHSQVTPHSRLRGLNPGPRTFRLGLLRKQITTSRNKSFDTGWRTLRTSGKVLPYNLWTRLHSSHGVTSD